MLTLEINVKDSATTGLARIAAAMRRPDEMHEAMGQAVKDQVASHLRATKTSPNTGWWGRAARSVAHVASAAEAVVSIPHRGVALRYHGGTVRQKPGGPLLTLPSDKVPIQDGTRRAAREMGPLAFLAASKANRASHTVGYLVQGETYTITRGRRRGQQGTRPKPGGALLYTLRTQTTHRPDPTVLPTDAQLLEAAGGAVQDYLATIDA